MPLADWSRLPPSSTADRGPRGGLQWLTRARRGGGRMKGPKGLDRTSTGTKAYIRPTVGATRQLYISGFSSPTVLPHDPSHHFIRSCGTCYPPLGSPPQPFCYLCRLDARDERALPPSLSSKPRTVDSCPASPSTLYTELPFGRMSCGSHSLPVSRGLYPASVCTAGDSTHDPSTHISVVASLPSSVHVFS